MSFLKRLQDALTQKAGEKETKAYPFRSLLIAVELVHPQLVTTSDFNRLQKDKGNSCRIFSAQEKSPSKLEVSETGIDVTVPDFAMKINVSITALEEMSGNYRLGFIQKVEEFFSQNRYVNEHNAPTGYAKWIIKDGQDWIKSEKEEDSPFVCQSAYFDFNCLLLSPNESTRLSLFFHDAPYTQASWTLRLDSIGFPGKNYLKHMLCQQKFSTWLAIQDRDTGYVHPLFSVQRDFYSDIEVTCVDSLAQLLPIHKRARLRGSTGTSQLWPKLTLDHSQTPNMPEWLSQGQSKQRPTHETMRFVWHNQSKPHSSIGSSKRDKSEKLED